MDDDELQPDQIEAGIEELREVFRAVAALDDVRSRALRTMLACGWSERIAADAAINSLAEQRRLEERRRAARSRRPALA